MFVYIFYVENFEKLSLQKYRPIGIFPVNLPSQSILV